MPSSLQLKAKPLPRHVFSHTDEVLSQGLIEGVAPGFVVGLWRSAEPEVAWIHAVGQRRLLLSAQPMQVDTVFDLASLSKVFATASLCTVLVQRGWVEWETPLRVLLPQYPDSRVRLSHLLSHTAGLPAWQPLWEKLKTHFLPRPLHQISVQIRQQEMRKRVVAIPLESHPGEKVVYSDLTFLLLGFALEELTGMPLDQAVRKFLWEPMGIEGAFYTHTTRDVHADCLSLVAATENCPWRGGVLQGQVHDDNVWAMGGFGGQAGVFARAQDVLQFAAQWLSGFFSPSLRQEAWSRVSLPKGCERTLGWDTPSGSESSAGKYFSSSSVGHLGFTGTSLWIDPEAGLAVTLLSNRVHPTRENLKIRAFRPLFHDAIREDLRVI